MDTFSLLRPFTMRTQDVGNSKITSTALDCIKNCVEKLFVLLKINLSSMIQESERVLTTTLADSSNSKAAEEHLQQIDMLFRFYLPLYALLHQTKSDFDSLNLLNKLLVNPKVVEMIGKRCKDNKINVAAILKEFVTSPSSVSNNKLVIQLQDSLDLTADCQEEETKPAQAATDNPSEKVVNVEDIQLVTSAKKDEAVAQGAKPSVKFGASKQVESNGPMTPVEDKDPSPRAVSDSQFQLNVAVAVNDLESKPRYTPEQEGWQKEVSDLYYERDTNKWYIQVENKKKDFIQKACHPPGIETVMFCARGNLKTTIAQLRPLIVDMNIRKRWESQLYNMRSYDQSADGKFKKTYYVYRSPMGMAHREFLLLQQEFPDFPKPGMWTLYMKTIEDPAVQETKGNVRATCHIMTLVLEERKDKDGNPQLRAMLCSNIDINGLVPKWIVNLASASAPSQWYTDA